MSTILEVKKVRKKNNAGKHREKHTGYEAAIITVGCSCN